MIDLKQTEPAENYRHIYGVESQEHDACEQNDRKVLTFSPPKARPIR